MYWGEWRGWDTEVFDLFPSCFLGQTPSAWDHWWSFRGNYQRTGQELSRGWPADGQRCPCQVKPIQTVSLSEARVESCNIIHNKLRSQWFDIWMYCELLLILLNTNRCTCNCWGVYWNHVCLSICTSYFCVLSIILKDISITWHSGWLLYLRLWHDLWHDLYLRPIY